MNRARWYSSARQIGGFISETRPGGAGFGPSRSARSLREAQSKNGIRVINIAPGYVRTNIHCGMHISFEEYRARLGNPDFVLFCWKQPQSICIRDLVVAPTRTTF
jgi:NADP-dependent 3-hydroxy acid dehydrogenase YdfG